MKSLSQFSIKGTTLITALLLFISCKKDTEKNAPYLYSPFSAPIAPPVAIAGDDQAIRLPVNSVSLNGTYRIQYGNFFRSTWKKLAGPFCIIEKPNDLTTLVSKLEEGFYVFELSVSDNLNREAKDTVVVSVIAPRVVELNVTVGQSSTIFSSLKWIQPWYPTLEIPEIAKYLPNGVIKKLYVQRANSSDWIQVPPVSSNLNNLYEYFIETRPDGAGMYNFGSLYVMLLNGTNGKTDDMPSIKVEY